MGTVVEYKLIDGQMTGIYLGPTSDIKGRASDGERHNYEDQIIEALQEADEPLKFRDIHATFPQIPEKRLRNILVSSSIIQHTGGSKNIRYHVEP